jgi:hypothetical protein
MKGKKRERLFLLSSLSPKTKSFAHNCFFFFSFLANSSSSPSLHNALQPKNMENATAVPQAAHAWETVKENFKPLKKGRRPEELAAAGMPLGLECAAPKGAEAERE